MIKRLNKGERVLANQTVRIDNRVVIVKNRYYLIHSEKYSCCQQVVDIGYMHPTPIRRTCANCSVKTERASRRVFIPSSYFRRKGEKIDGLDIQMRDLTKLFAKLG